MRIALFAFVRVSFVLISLLSLSSAVLATDGAIQITTYEGEDSFPAWSPLGDLIAFQSDRAGSANFDIWVIPPTGGTATPITTSPDPWDTGPCWSPDGTQIAFHSHRGGHRDVWRIPVAGGPAIAVTDDPEPDGSPSWSPDGSTLAIYSDRTGNWDIWLVDVLTGALTQFTTDPADDWSQEYGSDGCAIVCTSFRSGYDVWVLPLDGRPDYQVTFYAGWDGQPSFSPDCSMIAFHSDRGGNADIWIIPAEGGEALQVTSDPASDMVPTWSPDGTKIAFQSMRSGNFDIWVIDVPLASVPDAWGTTWGRIKAMYMEPEETEDKE